jgi:hypothetical protein
VTVTERDIELYLMKQVRALGGRALKMAPVSKAGLPDRVCVLPNGQVRWVELKRPGGKVTKIQSHAHAEFLRLGHFVHVLSTHDEVDTFIGRCRRALGTA